MRLIPSISPEASVSGQGKQGMTPSGAHQCCSASSSSQAGGGGWVEAGAIQHQESPSSVCGSCCLLHLLQWLQHGCCRARGTRGWGKIQGSRYRLCEGSFESWSGPLSKVTPPNGWFQCPRMLSKHVPSQSVNYLLKDVPGEECLQILFHFLADELLHWQHYFLLIGNKLKMARKLEGACFSSRVSIGVISFTKACTWPCIGHVFSVLPSPLVGWLVIAA